MEGQSEDSTVLLLSCLCGREASRIFLSTGRGSFTPVCWLLLGEGFAGGLGSLAAVSFLLLEGVHDLEPAR